MLRERVPPRVCRRMLVDARALLVGARLVARAAMGSPRVCRRMLVDARGLLADARAVFVTVRPLLVVVRLLFVADQLVSLVALDLLRVCRRLAATRPLLVTRRRVAPSLAMVCLRPLAAARLVARVAMVPCWDV